MAAIVPFYQRAPGPLTAALEGCFGQTRPPDALFLVDDGSPSPPEPELAALPAWARRRVHLVRRANGGPSAARNSGLEAAAAAGYGIVAFLDSDDVWLPCHLERSLDQLGGGAGISAVTSNWLPADGGPDAFAAYGLFGPAGHPLLPGRWGARRFVGDLAAWQLERPLGRLSTLVFDRQRHPGLRFDARLRHSAEDRLFFVEFALEGGELAVIEAPGCRSGRGVSIFAGVAWGDPRQLDIELDRLRVAAALADGALSPAARAALERFRQAALQDFWRHWFHQLRRGRPQLAALRRLFALAPEAVTALPAALRASLPARFGRR